MDQPLFGIKTQYVIEMLGCIERDGGVERLAVGARPAAARGDFDLAEFLAPGEFHHNVDIIASFGLQDGGWHHLIDAVVRRIDQAGREIGMDFTGKFSFFFKGFEETKCQTVKRAVRGQDRQAIEARKAAGGGCRLGDWGGRGHDVSLGFFAARAALFSPFDRRPIK